MSFFVVQTYQGRIILTKFKLTLFHLAAEASDYEEEEEESEEDDYYMSKRKAKRAGRSAPAKPTIKQGKYYILSHSVLKPQFVLHTFPIWAEAGTQQPDWQL